MNDRGVGLVVEPFATSSFAIPVMPGCQVHADCDVGCLAAATSPWGQPRSYRRPILTAAVSRRPSPWRGLRSQLPAERLTIDGQRLTGGPLPGEAGPPFRSPQLQVGAQRLVGEQ